MFKRGTFGQNTSPELPHPNTGKEQIRGGMIGEHGTSAPSLWCSACGRAVSGFGPGPNRRPNASCPHCGSLERHRFLALLLDGLAPTISSGQAALDIAPTPQIEQILRPLSTRYVRMDLDPAADRRSVDIQASLIAAPFADGAFDFILCYHVLEHVPDDAAAMRELGRLLAPGGFALVQVPWRPSAPTEEDPEAPPAERARRFGQADHVRTYGKDFEDRLLAAGLDVMRLAPLDVLGTVPVAALGLKADESVWVVRRARAGRAADPNLAWPSTVAEREPGTVRVPGEALRHTLARLVERQYEHIARLEARLQSAERVAQRYRRIRQLPPVRLVATLTRPFRRLT